MMRNTRMAAMLLCAGLALLPAFAGAATITDGLVAYWQFDEGSGTTAADASGNNNPGALENGPVWTTGIAGNGGLAFDGVDDAVNVHSPADLDNLPQLSLSVWAKADSYGQEGQGYFMDKSAGLGDGGWLFKQLCTDGCVVFQVDYSTTDLVVTSAKNTVTSADFGLWVHWLVAWDGTASTAGVHLYKNGQEVGVNTSPTVTHDAAGTRVDDAPRSLTIGNNSGSSRQRTFVGVLDDVSIYNRALSYNDVQAIYQAVTGADANPTVAITSPTDGASVTDALAVTADAADDHGLLGVQFKLDGNNLGAEELTAPYSTDWDTTFFPNGSHTLTATARDNAGHSTVSAPITVTVANASSGAVGLVAYYKFNESSGNTIADSSGHAHSGTVAGATRIPAMDNKALFFDGINDYANVPWNPSPIQGDNQSFTVAAWVDSFSDSGNHWILGDNDQYGHFLFGLCNGKLLVQWRYSAAWTFSEINTGQTIMGYHHVAATYDAPTKAAAVYVDGHPAKSDTTTQPLGIKDISSLEIGRGHAGATPEYWAGAIDEVRIYNRALLGDEIRDLYNNLPAIPPDAQAPTAISNLRQTGSTPNSVSLAWDASLDDSGSVLYKISRDGNNISAIMDTLYTDSGLRAGSYQYTVTAGDFAGNQSVPATLIGQTSVNPLRPNFTVDAFAPQDIQVGDEVMFDAESSTDDRSLTKGRFEWDFGDGYTLKYDPPDPPNTTRADSGIACSHFFMRPGLFTVTLTVTDTDNNTSSTMRQIPVTGEAPAAGFELWHAPYHARIAQYIYPQIPTAYRGNTTRITVTLSGDNGYAATLLDKSNLAAEERFLVREADLPPGNYTLTADLKKADGAHISLIRERFPKPYAGVPKVGINENNAICINGQPFFPVAPYQLDKGSRMADWAAKRCLNAVDTEGYYDPPPDGGPAHTTATWSDYLGRAWGYGWYAMGPGAWYGEGPQSFSRNGRPDMLGHYVETSKDHPALLAWFWDDEPNLGGSTEYVPWPVLRSWTFKTSQIDPEHPVLTGLAGYDYMANYYGPNGSRKYDYLSNQGEFGGKKTFAYDITGFDIFPLEMANQAWFDNSTTRREIEYYAAAIDNVIQRNYNLIPAMSTIEVSDNDSAGRNTPPPTPEQLRMEAWINVVHGIKGLHWFQYFDPVLPANFAEMARFVDQITRLTPIVLGPVPEATVSDDANRTGGWGDGDTVVPATAPEIRVDSMVREDIDYIYVFAVRVTEIKENYAAAHGVIPDGQSVVPVTFTLSADLSGPAEVFDEARWVNVVGGVFQDTFAPNAVHIYKVPKLPVITVEDISISEPDSVPGTADFVVRLSRASDQTVAVDYTTEDGSAKAGVDYAAKSGDLSFSPGTVSADVSVEVLGNLMDEPDRAFSLVLSNPVNATLGGG